MGVIKETSQEIKGMWGSFTSGIAIIGILSFIAGMFWYKSMVGTEMLYWPLYIGFFVLLAWFAMDFVKK